MKPLLKRRTVYAATLVGMLIVISGFTFAAGLFGGFTSTTVHGNQSSITAGTTIYGNGVTNTLFWNPTSAYTCGSQSTAAPTGGTTTTVTTWLNGAPTGCGTSLDYLMQITFTSNSTLTAGKLYTDTFVVSSEFGTATTPTTTFTTDSATIGCTPQATTGTTCQVVINIDTGVPLTQAQPVVDGIDVTVTGS